MCRYDEPEAVTNVTMYACWGNKIETPASPLDTSWNEIEKLCAVLAGSKRLTSIKISCTEWYHDTHCSWEPPYGIVQEVQERSTPTTFRYGCMRYATKSFPSQTLLRGKPAGNANAQLNFSGFDIEFRVVSSFVSNAIARAGHPNNFSNVYRSSRRLSILAWAAEA